MRVQLGQRAAIYCRVSTADQSCERQKHDLAAFAERASYEMAAVFKETGSGVKSGLAAAKARGKKLGRQSGQRPKSDRLAPRVLASIDEGRSYRWIAHDLGISKNTVAAIAKRHRENQE